MCPNSRQMKQNNSLQSCSSSGKCVSNWTVCSSSPSFCPSLSFAHQTDRFFSLESVFVVAHPLSWFSPSKLGNSVAKGGRHGCEWAVMFSLCKLWLCLCLGVCEFGWKYWGKISSMVFFWETRLCNSGKQHLIHCRLPKIRWFFWFYQITATTVHVMKQRKRVSESPS